MRMQPNPAEHGYHREDPTCHKTNRGDGDEMTLQTGDTYTCAECNGEFEAGWSEEEARAEQVENGFGEMPDSAMVVVCDDCYEQLFGEPIEPIEHIEKD